MKTLYLYIVTHVKKNSIPVYAAFLLLLAMPYGCRQTDKLNTFDRHVPIPGYTWNYAFHPSFEVNITDTAARYNIYVTIRHTNDYPFSNLWLLISSNYAGEKPKSQRVELPLADREGRWLGSGIDNIFDQRISIQQNARFNNRGIYHFSFEQNMRLDDLPHIMSVGLRIEKIPR
ncbi:MAG: gliding motility lipoprotein GldH [Chitinophagaceae bacterium]